MRSLGLLGCQLVPATLAVALSLRSTRGLRGGTHRRRSLGKRSFVSVLKTGERGPERPPCSWVSQLLSAAEWLLVGQTGCHEPLPQRFHAAGVMGSVLVHLLLLRSALTVVTPSRRTQAPVPIVKGEPPGTRGAFGRVASAEGAAPQHRRQSREGVAAAAREKRGAKVPRLDTGIRNSSAGLRRARRSSHESAQLIEHRRTEFHQQFLGKYLPIGVVGHNCARRSQPSARTQPSIVHSAATLYSSRNPLPVRPIPGAPCATASPRVSCCYRSLIRPKLRDVPPHPAG